MATTICKAICKNGTPCKCKTKFEVCGKHRGTSECPVCYSYYGKSDMTTLECGHSFCTKCIGNWFCESSDIVDSCPLCRKESLKVLSPNHVCKKVKKCLREIEIPNKSEHRVYYIDKMYMYLNTRHGRFFLLTHDIFRETFKMKAYSILEELNGPQYQTEYYKENSKNIKKACEYWKVYMERRQTN